MAGGARDEGNELLVDGGVGGIAFLGSANEAVRQKWHFPRG